jgi:deoxyribodipyrimidine photo-lyase
MESLMFSPTREEGAARLRRFVPRAGRHYAANRNTDEGEGVRQHVSVLSPYVRHRLVTEEEVLAAVLAQHSLPSAEKFVQEVFWRAYFKGYLETRPIIWQDYLRQLPADGAHSAYVNAINGQTGIDCFDHWVRELNATGYLHNHARMWFASIWIFTLQLPWAWGADFMYRHLMDGDPASNTLSWRWVGGLHTRGKTYLARPDNIARYTNGRFSPKGLATVAMPLEEGQPPPPRGLPSALSHAPEGRYGLLITEEDLAVESLFDLPAPASIAVVSHCRSRPGGDTSAAVRAFVRGALEDARLRAATHWNTEVAVIGLDAETLSDWCAEHAVTTLATAYAAVGPVAAALDAITPGLEMRGITLLRVRRRYDTLNWPHATKGYFALKERIPALLGKLQVCEE